MSHDVKLTQIGFDIVDYPNNVLNSTFPLVNVDSRILSMNDTTPEEYRNICTKYRANLKYRALIYTGYEGIPENLIINLIAFFIILCLFTLLRRIGDHGRLALLPEQKWQTIFRDPTAHEEIISTNDEGDQMNDDVEHDMNRNNKVRVKVRRAETKRHASPTDSLPTKYVPFKNHSLPNAPTEILSKDESLLDWVKNFFKMDQTNFKSKIGPDAEIYLRFQKYLIVYMWTICTLSISIILPLNYLAPNSTLSKDETFAKSTISNMDPKSNLLWVHVVMSFLYLVLAVIFMDRFTNRTNYAEDDTVTRTLMIYHIPLEVCQNEIIAEYFLKQFNVRVQSIDFARNVSLIFKYQRLLDRARGALNRCESELREHNHTPTIIPHRCGTFCNCCCPCCPCWERENAIEFYGKKVQKFKNKLENTRSKIELLGIAFVTLPTMENVYEILKELHRPFHCFSYCMGGGRHHTIRRPLENGEANIENRNNHSQVTENTMISEDGMIINEINGTKLKTTQWIVDYAPSPKNIKWENLSNAYYSWWIRFILLNIGIFLIMIFLTTPSIIIVSIRIPKFNESLTTNSSNYMQSKVLTFIQEFSPVIILRICAATLPVIVSQSALIEYHWTKSAENVWLMRRTFTFLLFMILICPSLGLASLLGLFSSTDPWKCIFLPDNGAFFVNYVIFSAFIGTAVELCRLPALFLYVCRLAWTRSFAEQYSVKKAVTYEYQFGLEYAWTLAISGIVLTYSIICPIITPFGAVYISFKYLVDRYNLYYAFSTSSVDKQFHRTAVNFFLLLTIIVQIILFFFTYIRSSVDDADGKMIALALMVTISFGVWIGRVVFGFFKDIHIFGFKILREDHTTTDPPDEYLDDYAQQRYSINDILTDQS
ncbi:hypothetical protein SNEBB_009687 [Seison nebaliae]|nr:hypothetical protein SNEBB_009687 [Seison nebaliae]